MKQSQTQNTKSTKYSWPTILLAMAASVSTASADAMPPKYMVAGVYPTRSKTARTASKIDLDQAEIERLLALDLLNRKDSKFLDQARRVYEHGMNSGSYAALTLIKNADHKIDLPDRTESVYYNSVEYDPKQHSVYELSVAGMNEDFDKHIKGTYRTTSDDLSILTLNVFYPDDSMCDQGHADECFAQEGGIVLEGYGALDYVYDPSMDNYYSSSLKWYTQDEAMRMYYCEEHGNCNKYTQYEHMFNFYGVLDYGNEWIESAFLNKKTHFPRNFKTSHGYEDVDFGHFSDLARNVFIQTATVALNVFTQINRLMIEFGLDGCKKNSKDFSSYGSHLSKDSIIASWDQAAALYAGSVLIAPEGSTTDSTKTGSLYYHMVGTLAKEFGAMQVDETTNQPVSIVNQKIMDAFATGKVAIEQSDCEVGVRSSYFTITNHMKTPWIQGVLKAAFEFSNSHYDNKQDREEQGGKAAAYMAALLPNLYECSPEAAEIVMEELSVMWPHGNSEKLRPDFARVRKALEHQYQCFGVTCDEVGGFINPETGDYFEETRPCGGYGTMLTQRRDSVDYSPNESLNSFSKSSKSPLSDKKGLVMSSFFVALALFFVTLAALVVTVRDRSRNNFATRLVSGALSQADYWLSQQRGEQTYNPVNNDYEVQLRPMSHLQPGEESLI
eukprot:CAMPEP_0197265246 /NCGR_PEP_ID=MMETSP1432-20130617/2279_1 /TAXON_ID=44447 /ORGANISM="Pseudo-nitzschia delicatissima, Strain UNC1205" /LENGTH=669 /DNA_ID=CAMNT_0042729973 /DNA_START=29 /DNA_END=2038 /DNA_ORIENTATION=-